MRLRCSLFCFIVLSFALSCRPAPDAFSLRADRTSIQAYRGGQATLPVEVVSSTARDITLTLEAPDFVGASVSPAELTQGRTWITVQPAATAPLGKITLTLIAKTAELSQSLDFEVEIARLSVQVLGWQDAPVNDAQVVVGGQSAAPTGDGHYELASEPVAPFDMEIRFAPLQARAYSYRGLSRLPAVVHAPSLSPAASQYAVSGSILGPADGAQQASMAVGGPFCSFATFRVTELNAYAGTLNCMVEAMLHAPLYFLSYAATGPQGPNQFKRFGTREITLQPGAMGLQGQDIETVAVPSDRTVSTSFELPQSLRLRGVQTSLQIGDDVFHTLTLTSDLQPQGNVIRFALPALDDVSAQIFAIAVPSDESAGVSITWLTGLSPEREPPKLRFIESPVLRSPPNATALGAMSTFQWSKPAPVSVLVFVDVASLAAYQIVTSDDHVTVDWSTVPLAGSGEVRLTILGQSAFATVDDAVAAQLDTRASLPGAQGLSPVYTFTR